MHLKYIEFFKVYREGVGVHIWSNARAALTRFGQTSGAPRFG